MKWKIQLKTSNALGAGSDADVYLILAGTTGRTAEVQLDNPGSNDFERGNLDTFLVDLKDVGKITKIFLRVVSTVAGDNWLPEWIRCEDLEHGRKIRGDLGAWSDDNGGTYAPVAIVEDAGTYDLDKAREEAARREQSNEADAVKQQDELDRELAAARKEAEIAVKRAELEKVRRENQVKLLPRAKELSIVNKSVFYALTDSESRDDAQSPHKGTSLCEADSWMRAVGGKLPSEYGLPIPLLAWRNGSIVPADQEVAQLKAYNGKYKRQVDQVLRAIGL